jgi:hypothetical protein
MPRKATPPEIEHNVLVLCRRRCCLCYGLHSDRTIKQGQIAHLDRNSAHFEIENLAFLCLPHHDQYDARTSQSKRLTEREVKRFRQQLHDLIARDPDSLKIDNPPVEFRPDAPSRGDGIDGEIYRLDIAPRNPSWEILKDAYRIWDKPEEVTTDFSRAQRVCRLDAATDGRKKETPSVKLHGTDRRSHGKTARDIARRISMAAARCCRRLRPGEQQGDCRMLDLPGGHY